MISRVYQWYAITVRPRHELSAFGHFVNSGIKCYCPTEKVLVQRCDRRVWVEKPLFSMYVFIWASIKEYLDILRYHSVIDFVRSGGIPCNVPEREILGLMETLENGKAIEISNNMFKSGQSVTISGGPFKGLEGEVVTIKGKQRLKIRISYLDYCLLLNAGDVLHL